MKKKSISGIVLVILTATLVYAYNNYSEEIDKFLSKNVFLEGTTANEIISYDLEKLPKYNGESYVVINNNEPFFDESDMTNISFERYSNLDSLGRCGVAYANIGTDIMPTEERESIGMIKPSGWHTIKYDIIDGKYLYNRCHLIGYQLSGENANKNNLITCTRQMNIGAMLDFENKVANYVKKTNNHVLYRVTPIFDGNNLLASGVLMEGLSIEDNGEGIKFNVYIYNVQDGIIIDYNTGESRLDEDYINTHNLENK